jgi:uncharacterized protein YeaO (DUF488 family)
VNIRIKRVYESPAEADGFRVLVDRLWPRGISREKACLDEWLKDIAPSMELRTWFGHKPERFEEFQARYQIELAANPAVQELRGLAAKHPVVTLLYGAHDPEINHARVLLQYLKSGR